MGKYTFLHHADDGATTVQVTYNDDHDASLTPVLAAFEQFLLGVTFQPGSIAKYLDMGAVHDHEMAMAVAMAEHTGSYGGTTDE